MECFESRSRLIQLRPMFRLSRSKLGMFRLDSTNVSTVLDLCLDSVRRVSTFSTKIGYFFYLLSTYVSTFQ